MVDLQRQLSSLGQQVEAKQGELDDVRQRLNNRLAALGQREQSFAAIDRQQSQTEHKLAQLLVQTSRAAAELTRQNGELGQVERALADKQRTLSVTSTQLDRTQKQLASLDEQVSGLTRQRTAIEAEIARRGAIAERVTDIRGRLSSLLGGDLAQLKQVSESALAQADAIQRSLDELEGEDKAAQAQETGEAEISDQDKATN
jgi:chromosome segregation ATPase